jgi:hypothetical protein
MGYRRRSQAPYEMTGLCAQRIDTKPEHVVYPGASMPPQPEAAARFGRSISKAPPARQIGAPEKLPPIKVVAFSALPRRGYIAPIL